MQMERIYTSQLSEHVGERVWLMGWLHHVRRLSEITFLILRDKEGLAQIVSTEHSLSGEEGHIPHESVISIQGIVVAEAQAPGGYELHEPRIEVISPALDLPVFDMFRPSIKALLPTILDHAALSLRHPRQRALWRMAAASMSGFRSALTSRGFTEIQTPKIVASATEGGANVFKLDYFGRPAYLAQSHSSTSKLWSVCSSGCLRLGLFSGPSHTAPHATSTSMCRWTSRWALSTTTAT